MNTYTARDISRACGTARETRISRQGVAKLLLDVPPSGVRVERGNQETPAWTLESLPAELRRRLQLAVKHYNYRNEETLLANPPASWSPPVPLRDVTDDEQNRAAKLRDVLAHYLRDTSKPAADRDALIAARYGDAFGHVITADYARKLYQRTLDRDAGLGDFGRLEIYLSENPRRREAPEWTNTASNLADTLPALESRIAAITTPGNPPKSVVRSVWHVAFEEYTRLVSQGADQCRTARILREFLHDRAPFMPRNRDTLLKSWNEKLPRWLAREGAPGALVDLRCQNGRDVVIPEADIARLRHGAAFKNSGGLDAAWR